MNQMIYSISPKIGGGVLGEGSIDGYDWMIISYGTHPCAYVKLQNDHPYYGKDYDYMNIDVHGGITYAEMGYHCNIPGFPVKDGFWIGWDYNHFNDFNGLINFKNTKMWTTEEIFDDVKSVIEQLKSIKENET